MIIHKSTIRVGTTEGRFRMIMPNLMRQFKEMYNDYDIRGVIGNAEQLREMLEKEGLRAVILNGGTEDKNEARDGFNDGTYDVIITNRFGFYVYSYITTTSK